MEKRMNRLLIVFIFCLFNVLSLQSSDFTSSTSVTSELTGIIKNANLSPDEVLTSREIKLLGIESIPDLLRYINGINIYRINNSTANYSMRGIPGFYRIHPLILIDGMEYSQNLYDKVFFYTLPVSIDDIDRVEVIKDPTRFVNGLESAGGIINIVTKKPEFISNNYLEGFLGTNRLNVTGFSYNNYLKGFYYKITGEFNKKDKYHSKKRAITKNFITFSGTKFFEFSKVFSKLSFLNIDFNFIDLYRTKINNQMLGSTILLKIKNQHLIDYILDYTSNNTNVSLYYQHNSGDIMLTSGKFYSYRYDYSKFNFKRFIKIKNINLTSGVIASIFNSSVKSIDKGKRGSMIIYLNSKIKLTKNISVNGFLKNERTKNLGNTLSFKTNIKYFISNKRFLIELGYSKSFIKPPVVNQYYTIKQRFHYFNMPVNILYKGNRNLNPEKIYSTFFNISKGFGNLSLKTSFFYNRLTNLFTGYGNLNIFQRKIFVSNKNYLNFTIHGIETTLDYKFNRNLWLTSSFYAQHFNNKTKNVQGNHLIPKYKFMSLIFFDYPIISGNLLYNYIPAIKTTCSGKSDYVSTLDLTIKKSFYNNKITSSLTIQNLFKDHAKESTYGEKLERNVIFKIRYDF